MKRLLTIFVSSVLGMGLYAQTAVPVTIVGDVYNAGDVVSLGTVHMKALGEDGKPGDAKVGRLDNFGNLDVRESIILYTNQKADGLLRNNHKVVGGQHASYDAKSVGVAVRKTFEKGATWYTVSFPFDVDLTSGVKNASNGQVMVQGTGFRVQFYDAQKRSERGINDDANWVVLSTESQARYIQAVQGATTFTGLKKGIAYRIQLNTSVLPLAPAAGVTFDVDFVAKQADVAGLLKNDDKGISLSYFAPADSLVPSQTDGSGKVIGHWSDGWNVIGGLNTDLFNLSANPDNPTIGYDRAVYYSNGTAWAYMNPIAQTGIVRPYSVMWIRSDSVMNKSFVRGSANPMSRTPYGGFAFYYNGNAIESVAGGIAFRSLQASNADYDFFELNLTDSHSNTKPIWFKMNNKYDKIYKATEDDVIFGIEKGDLSLWSTSADVAIGTKVYNMDLITNATSYKDIEKEGIPVGVNIPAKGDYVFSLRHVVDPGLNKIVSVVLKDLKLNKSVDLTKEDYTFKADKALNTNEDGARFVLFFKTNDFTGIDEIPSATEVYAFAENNILTVKNVLEGDRIQIFDLSGRLIVTGIASSNTFTASLNQKGVYIVNVRGGKTLRVLNK